MKVLFLDIDGVLNSVSWFKRREKGGERPFKDIDPLAIAKLGDFLQKTGVKVVISSTWRKIHKLPTIAEVFVKAGLPQELKESLIDTTPCSPSAFRGEEIQEWLSHHPEVEAYAIIDDDSDMLEEQMPYFVKTSVQDGLLDVHVQLLKVILNLTSD